MPQAPVSRHLISDSPGRHVPARSRNLSPGPGLNPTVGAASHSAMQGMQGRDQGVVTRAGTWPELLGVLGWTRACSTRVSTYRGVVMSDNRSPVLDLTLVALLVALAFDALSTALVWGLIQHLPS